MTIVFLSVAAYILMGGLVCFFILRNVYKRQLAYQEKKTGIAVALASILLWSIMGLGFFIANGLDHIRCSLDSWFKKTYGEKK